MQEINHSQRTLWILPVLIALLCIGLELAELSLSLRFDRDLVENGRWWLLFSCNFVHLGTNHLLLNLSGLGLIYFLLWPNYTTVEWLAITVVSSIGVGLGVYLWSPELHWYVGFSGALHGLMIAGAIADIRRYPKSGAALLVLIIAKLSYEQLFGAVPGSESAAGGTVAVDSHLYGAILGALCGIVFTAIKHRRNCDSRLRPNA